MNTKVNKIVTIGVLSALSIVLLMLVRFPLIPSANFLIYEPADVPILIVGFIFGPMSGLITTIIVSLIQALVFESSGSWVGPVMHIIATGTFVMVSSIIYKKLRTIKGAIIGLIVGAIAMTAIMIPSNLFFTVKFYGYPYDAVVALLPSAIIPFNLLKSGINAVLTLLVYKSIKNIINKTSK